MANNHVDNSNVDSESSPLLEKRVEEEAAKEGKSKVDSKPATVEPPPSEKSGSVAPEFAVCGRTAYGLPLGHGSVMGEPMGRSQWDSGLCDCFGRDDEFCSDLEVCLLGSFAPCVLFGCNVERLDPAPGNFATFCVCYTCLSLIGNALFHSNFLAACFSYPNRTAIRHKFNLEGGAEALYRSCGCCGSCVENDLQRENCESACDFATHLFCHRCALCQEGRELRRRLLHPRFNAQTVLVMIPPGEQTMGRGA